MSIRLSRFSGLFVLIVLGSAGATMAFAKGAAGRAPQADSLVVGVDYVVPPFIAGAKVRTPEAIDTTSETVSLVKQMASQWKAHRYLAVLTETRARDIAFEVYLDQNVPDCH
ncbi:MAG: hypothetical protein ABI228_07075 [Burkholderiaceae bacterium]